MIEWLIQLDTQLFLFLNSLHCSFLNPIMIFFSGKLTWLPLYLLIVYYMYRRFGWRMVWALLAVGVLITLTDQISASLFRPYFERLRPCHNPLIKHLVHLPTGRCSGGKFGFVSSHAANTFGLAMLLSFLFQRKWFTISIFIWAALVSYSRIYLGVHFPGDILGGALLGLLIGYGVWILYHWLTRRFSPIQDD